MQLCFTKIWCTYFLEVLWRTHERTQWRPTNYPSPCSVSDNTFYALRKDNWKIDNMLLQRYRGVKIFNSIFAIVSLLWYVYPFLCLPFLCDTYISAVSGSVIMRVLWHVLQHWNFIHEMRWHCSFVARSHIISNPSLHSPSGFPTNRKEKNTI